MGLKKYRVFRLHQSPEIWVGHYHWDETPEGLKAPLTYEGAMDLIKWARSPGERYCIRSTELIEEDYFQPSTRPRR